MSLWLPLHLLTLEVLLSPMYVFLELFHLKCLFLSQSESCWYASLHRPKRTGNVQPWEPLENRKLTKPCLKKNKKLVSFENCTVWLMLFCHSLQCAIIDLDCHWDGCALQVILSTNIAETSVTVPGVRYVVDTGFVKARAYSSKAAAECLQVVPVSQAQARQRAGRAGHCTPPVSLNCLCLTQLPLSHSNCPCLIQLPLSHSTAPVPLNCPCLN